MAATWLQQMKVMMWKAFLIKRRHPGSLYWEFFSPVMYVVILAVVKMTAQGKPVPQFGDFPEYSLISDRFVSGSLHKTRVLVTPEDPFTQTLMSDVQQVFTSLTNMTFTTEFYSNKSAAETEFLQNNGDIFAGIIFNFNGKGNLSYALRYPKDTLPADTGGLFTIQGSCRTTNGDKQENDNALQNDDNCKVNKFLFTGFAQLQMAIDKVLIENQYGVTFTLQDVLIQMLPKPAYLRDNSYIQIMSAMYYVLAFLPLVAFFVAALVAEKQKKIKEGMKMMGLKGSVFWASWFAVFILQIFIITIIVTIIVVAFKFFVKSNIFLFFILVIFYGLSMVGIACLMSPFFDNAMKAGFLASIATMLVSCLYLAISLTREYGEGTGSVKYSIPVYGRWLLCLFSPVAFALGIDQAIYLDFHDGLNFTTARQGEFPFYGPLIMLIIDTILYFLLSVYLDNVIPGEYGPKQKPNYIFTKAFWCPQPRGNSISSSASYENGAVQFDENGLDPHDESIVEPVPPDMRTKASVRIHDLKKVFKNREKGKEDIVAVNGLSLTIYEDQITAILGHNGAGKTTLMNILTGMTGATSGNASIKGLDVSDPHDIEVLRSMTGVCPQYNLLFDELSCYEHLYLFAGIKGVDVDKVENAIDEALKSVDLTDQKHTRSTDLSGGQKRKLCVAIAIIGDPKVIFLDEPTAGMDPYSRRILWKTLKEIKKGRIILLTTHFMDEADILADRKAIVNKGSLRCCGSSFFLKNKFGIGYHLNMVVEPDCDTEKISEVVSSVVPGAEVNRVHGKELDITLPQSGVEQFPDLFGKLETPSMAQSLGVKNFGISMTTLEEVFLKLEEDAESIELDEIDEKSVVRDTEDLIPRYPNYGSAEVNMSGAPNPSDTVEVVTGRTLAFQRYSALFIVHLKNHLRNKMAHIFQVLIPVALVIVGLVMAKSLQSKYSDGEVERQQSLVLTPSYYIKMNPSLGLSQWFPYGTVPRFLMRDTVNTTASETLVTGLSGFYETDSTYPDSYFSDMYQLLAKNIAPHYLGVQMNQFTIGASTLTSAYKVLYNDSAVCSIPTTLNLMHNAFLRAIQAATGSTDNSTLEVSNYPWPKVKTDEKTYNGGAFASVLLVAMAFSFIPASFGVDIVKDRQFKVRSQMRVTGMTFFLYWSAIFSVHFLKFLLPAVLTIIVVLIAQVDSLLYGGAMFSFILICLLYIPANIFFSYFISFCFTKWETCMSVQPTIYIMLGYIPYIPISIMDMVMDNTTIPNILHYIFCVLDPAYLIFGGIYYIDKIHQTSQLKGTSISFGDYFAFSSNIPIVIIMAVVHICLFFFLLRVLDIYKTGGDVREACLPRSASRKHISVTNQDKIEDEDNDVSFERDRVKDLAGKTDSEMPVVIAENLRKEFKKASKNKKCVGCKSVPKSETVKAAVRNQTFAVEAGEVFGLLGPNGAGKTTSLNLMIADIGPDCGRVIVGGYNIRSNMSEAFQMVGYCPQHDALWEDITLKEHLVCYAKIRGIPSDQVTEITNFFIDSLKLKEHENKAASKLSGGTKRKLSYCMSMLGRPKIVLLDEPSTGMDPQSKRFLWDTISSSFENSERGAILTTHYMEEADALCSRIAIMVNGKMMCIGSSQHLKNKYGSGYMLEIKIKSTENAELLEENMVKLHGYIKNLFPLAKVMEQFGERVQYKVPKSDVVSLSQTFTVLEKGKEEYGIAEYSFSQSTLEQVFLDFAKHQMDEEQTEEEVDRERHKSFKTQRSLESPEFSPSAVRL